MSNENLVRFGSVEVSRNRNIFLESNTWVVNFPSFGSISPEDATIFRNDLNRALEFVANN